jgi:hypothetical protein
MTSETKATPAPQTDDTPALSSPQQPAAPAPITIPPSGRQALDLYKKQIATYVRELPRLLEEGYAWKHALVKGDELLSIWDTQNDAVQAGVERFGLEPFFCQND